MKSGVMRTCRSSSGLRPSVRLNVSLAGVKLIVTPDLDGLQTAGRAPQKPLGDVREALGRVRHVEVVQIIAQKARVRTCLAQVPQLLRRRAPQVLALDDLLDLSGRRLARIDQLDALSGRLLYDAPQDGVVRAAEDERAQALF